jgi:hypothetical protein
MTQVVKHLPTKCKARSSVLSTANKRGTNQALMKIKITFCILSDAKRVKLKINSKRNYRKYRNTWKLKKTLLNDQ